VALVCIGSIQSNMFRLKTDLRKTTNLARGSFFGLGLIAALLAAGATQAQEGDTAKLQRQFDAAFSAMLTDPADLDKTFFYAETAIKIGDFEAAISALERMLLYNPDLPRIRLELGVLYFRLGSYTIARSYLTGAVAGENVPDDVKANVAKFLAEIDKRQSRHNFAGSIFGGLRYQTNANAGPERAAISLFGADATLDEAFTRKDDANTFVVGNVRHTYDPQLQSGDVLETNATLYASQQQEQNQLDLVYSTVTFGPRGQFLRDTIDNASWRPYVRGTMVTLDNAHYYWAYGAGVSIDKQFTPATTGEIEVKLEQRRFSANSERPTARNQNSNDAELLLSARHQVFDWLMLTANASAKNTDADESLNSNTEGSIGGGAITYYSAPLSLTTQPWTTSLTGSLSYSRYHAPDSSVDPNRKRRDRQVEVSLLTSVPITSAWSMTATVQRTVVHSTFLNFSYSNNSATLGASYRF
jgi:tetratricopeptide (TPR) repeat protein